MSFYVGKYKADSQEYRGWFIGSFVESGPRKTDDVEVKYWEFGAGPTGHPMKVSSTLESTLILSGETEAEIDGERITLTGGDYVVIQPGIHNNLLVNVVRPTVGITIKAPSDVTAKKIVKE